jgi:hypothetical protein
MANSTTTDVAAIIEKRVSSIVTETLIQESVALPTMMDLSSQVGPGMDRLDVPLFNELAAQDVSESAAMTAQVINPSAAQLSLDQHKAIPFSITRRAGTQSKVALVPEALRNGARTLAAAVDDFMFGLIDAGTATAGPDHRQALTADPLADIVLAKRLLDEANVPRGNRYLAASPGFCQALLGTSNIIRAQDYGSSQPIQNGYVGSVYGFMIVETSSSSIIDDGFQAYHMDAAYFARQIQPELRVEEKALEMRDDYVLSHLYGGVYSDSSGVRSVVFDADGV